MIFRICNCLLNRSEKLVFKRIVRKVNIFVSAFIASFYTSIDKDIIKQQTFHYLFGRSIVGSIEYSMKYNYIPTFKYWSILASLVWGILVFYFEVNRKNLNLSLVKSLRFLLIDSDS